MAAAATSFMDVLDQHSRTKADIENQIQELKRELQANYKSIQESGAPEHSEDFQTKMGTLAMQLMNMADEMTGAIKRERAQLNVEMARLMNFPPEKIKVLEELAETIAKRTNETDKEIAEERAGAAAAEAAADDVEGGARRRRSSVKSKKSSRRHKKSRKSRK